MTKLNAIKTALKNAKSIGATVHVARNASDFPNGAIIGRTPCDRLIYETEGGARAVLFADWLKLNA